MTWLDPKKVQPMEYDDVVMKHSDGSIGVWLDFRWDDGKTWQTLVCPIIGWMPLEWLEEELDE